MAKDFRALGTERNYFKYQNYIKMEQTKSEKLQSIKDMIELYDDNYNAYRRTYLQTQSDNAKFQMNKYLKLKQEQEILLNQIIKNK